MPTKTRAKTARTSSGARYVTVRAGYFPGGRFKEVQLSGAKTVKEAVEKANLKTSGRTIRVNDKEATMKTRLTENDTVMLSKRIRGN